MLRLFPALPISFHVHPFPPSFTLSSHPTPPCRYLPQAKGRHAFYSAARGRRLRMASSAWPVGLSAAVSAASLFFPLCTPYVLCRAPRSLMLVALSLRKEFADMFSRWQPPPSPGPVGFAHGLVNNRGRRQLVAMSASQVKALLVRWQVLRRPGACHGATDRWQLIIFAYHLFLHVHRIALSSAFEAWRRRIRGSFHRTCHDVRGLSGGGGEGEQAGCVCFCLCEIQGRCLTTDGFHQQC